MEGISTTIGMLPQNGMNNLSTILDKKSIRRFLSHPAVSDHFMTAGDEELELRKKCIPEMAEFMKKTNANSSDFKSIRRFLSHPAVSDHFMTAGDAELKLREKCIPQMAEFVKETNAKSPEFKLMKEIILAMESKEREHISYQCVAFVIFGVADPILFGYITALPEFQELQEMIFRNWLSYHNIGSSQNIDQSQLIEGVRKWVGSVWHSKIKEHLLALLHRFDEDPEETWDDLMIFLIGDDEDEDYEDIPLDHESTKNPLQIFSSVVQEINVIRRNYYSPEAILNLFASIIN